jgi:hypothetical protein
MMTRDRWWVAAAAVLAGLVLWLAPLRFGQAQETGGQAAPKPEWESIFNKRDLTGWQPVGGAKWTVQDGVLIGQQNNGVPGDLFTTREWTDFELQVTFKVRSNAKDRKSVV